MHRFPRSTLLLLDPSKSTERHDAQNGIKKSIDQNELSKLNLFRQTQYFGIESTISKEISHINDVSDAEDRVYNNGRVSFVPRAPKEDHIKRLSHVHVRFIY